MICSHGGMAVTSGKSSHLHPSGFNFLWLLSPDELCRFGPWVLNHFLQVPPQIQVDWYLGHVRAVTLTLPVPFHSFCPVARCITISKNDVVIPKHLFLNWRERKIGRNLNVKLAHFLKMWWRTAISPSASTWRAAPCPPWFLSVAPIVEPYGRIFIRSHFSELVLPRAGKSAKGTTMEAPVHSTWRDLESVAIANRISSLPRPFAERERHRYVSPWLDKSVGTLQTELRQEIRLVAATVSIGLRGRRIWGFQLPNWQQIQMSCYRDASVQQVRQRVQLFNKVYFVVGLVGLQYKLAAMRRLLDKCWVSKTLFSPK